MNYVLPDKSLLEDKSDEIKEEDKYYNLSKLTFKKDLNKKLLFPIGLNNIDKYYIDLEEKSSILILGETGSGKSNLINSIIISLLLKNNPEELKLLLIDPRGVEFYPYAQIPHLIKPVITDSKKALLELNLIKSELERRRDLFLNNNVRSIAAYNERFEKKLPHLIIIVDEASELLEANNFEKDYLELINDGWRYGIHTILSTSARLEEKLSTFFLSAFNYIITYDLASKEQAEYIKINEADLLTVYGEALVKCVGHDLIDLQTPYVSEKDITNIVDFINKQ